MFRWLCQFAERPADIPAAILRSAVLGVLLGPLFGLLVNWLFRGSWDDLWTAPLRTLGTSALIGAIFSSTFYIMTGMPWVFLRRVVHGLPPWRTWLLAVSICAVGGAGGALASIHLVEAVLGRKIVPEAAFSRAVVVDAIIAVVLGLFIGNIRRLQLERTVREQALRETAAKAQAYALQAQIAPHFFFNALNSISALIPVRPDAAQRALWQLADILRYTFACGREETVTLDKELEFVRRYLDLEQLRYGDRLRFELPSPECSESVRLPGLTLQPLVENAVRHGIARRMDGGAIRVEVAPVNGDCRISVWNQFDPADGPPSLDDVFDEGHALENVRKRLRLAFGGHAAVTLEHAGADWVRATLIVPTTEAAPESTGTARAAGNS